MYPMDISNRFEEVRGGRNCSRVVFSPNSVAPSNKTGSRFEGQLHDYDINKENQAERTFEAKDYANKLCFDYSTNDGLTLVSRNDIAFQLRFSKGSTRIIHLYKNSTNLIAIARLRNVKPGEHIDFSNFDHTSRVYDIGVGEYFMAENQGPDLMLGRCFP